MIKYLLGNEEIIGYYNAGYRLVEAFVLFPTMVIAPLYPVFARRNDEKAYISKLALNSTRIITVVSLGVCLPLFLLSTGFTRFLYGQEFSPAADAIKFLPFVMVPIGLTWIFGTLVAASGRQSKANYYITAITVANVVGHFLMIPKYGLLGAIIVTLGTECAIAATYIWIMRDHLNYEFLWLGMKLAVPPIVIYLLHLTNIFSGSFFINLMIVLFILGLVFLSLRLVSMRDIRQVFSTKS
jgi:O-antigen/teichoic acid export membrane protein